MSNLCFFKKLQYVLFYMFVYVILFNILSLFSAVQKNIRMI